MLRGASQSFASTRCLIICGFLAVFTGDIRLPGHSRDIGNRDRVAVHVTVDGGPVTASSDGHFHAVAVIDLPEKAVGAEVAFLPSAVIRHPGLRAKLLYDVLFVAIDTR